MLFLTFVEVFSSSRDLLYGDDDLPSRMAVHGMTLRQPSASRLFNSAYESSLQMEDLNSDGDAGVEQMPEKISRESELVLSAGFQL